MSTSSESKSSVIALAELMKIEYPESEWLVNGWVEFYVRRISLIVGKSGVGKSCLGRQLIWCVSSQPTFLGQTVKRVPSLYFQTEETPRKIQKYFKQLGYNPDTDAPIYVFQGGLGKGKSDIDAMAEILKTHPDIRFVCIECLDNLVRVKDLSSNTDSRESFEEFDTKLVQQFPNVAFVALHHIRKKEASLRRDAILGAMGLQGRADTIMFINKVSDDDPRRTFAVETRDGENLDDTFLVFDETKRTSSLGQTVSAEKKQHAQASEENIRRQITGFLISQPDSNDETDVLPHVSGNRDAARRIFKLLVREGVIEKAGTGKKGDSFKYRLKTIPVEAARPVAVIPEPVKVIPETKPQPPVDFDAALRAEPNKEKRAALLAQYRAARQTSGVVQ